MPRPAVTALNLSGSSPYVLLCEHASNHIPARYAGLGLPPEELRRHIAWDIGAADLARALSGLLDAPLFLAGYSRLLIDCNRPPGAPTSIPVRSEATDIPGNQGLDEAERAARDDAFFRPFRERVTQELDRRRDQGRRTLVVGVHSFTPVYLGQARPMQAGILYGRAVGFGAALLAALRAEPGRVVGDNAPYRVGTETDYTVPVHGDGRGLDAALLEVRQDLLADPAGIAEWAQRLAAALCVAAGDLSVAAHGEKLVPPTRA